METVDGSSGTLVSSVLRYTDAWSASSSASWTGNISSWTWEQAGQSPRTYAFGYDGLDRLVSTSQYLNSTLENKYGEDLVYDRNGNVLEQFDYLPYGQKCNNSSLAVANQYKTDYLYTGKELQQLFGIDWYDSVARWQTTSGVFTSPDPLAEEYYPLSPNNYCAGDPVNLVDPEGMTKLVFYVAINGWTDSNYELTMQINSVVNEVLLRFQTR